MRPLARVQAEALRERGIDVLLVTTDQHPESDEARDYELVLGSRFSTSATLAAHRRIREHRADIVIAEQDRDPRWIALAGRAPRIQLVHDERRDDGRPRQVPARTVFDRWGAHSSATVTYSNYAAIAVATRRDVAGTSVHVVPLCGDLDSELIPSFVGPDGRRDFVLAGRLDSHKNVDVILEAWQRHVDGDSWRGDELLLLGGEARGLVGGRGDVRRLVDVRDADPRGDRDHRQQWQRRPRAAATDAQPPNQRFERDVVDAGCRRGRRTVDAMCETQVGHCPDLQW